MIDYEYRGYRKYDPQRDRARSNFRLGFDRNIDRGLVGDTEDINLANVKSGTNLQNAPTAEPAGKPHFIRAITDDAHGGYRNTFVASGNNEYKYKTKNSNVSAVIKDNGDTCTLTYKGTKNPNPSDIVFNADDPRNTIYEGDPLYDDPKDKGVHLVLADVKGKLVDVNIDKGTVKPYKESMNKSIRESIVKSYVVIDARDNTIVGIYKTADKAELKAGGFNAYTNSNNYVAKPFYEVYHGSYSFSKDLLDKITDHFAESKKLKEANDFNDTLNYLKRLGTKEKYMFLSRMQSDCEYILGSCKDYWTKDWKEDPSMMHSTQTVANNGLKNSLRHLWASGDVDAQIAYMRYLYSSLKDKPEWISMEDIDRYEKELKEIETMNEKRIAKNRLNEVMNKHDDTIECQLYSCYGSYFVNGDESGLSDEELEEVHALEEAIEAYTGATYCLDVLDDADFGDVEIPKGHRCKSYGGFKFLPGDVCTYVFRAQK